MKNIRLMVAACALIIVGNAGAQTIYDVNRFLGSDLNGTARFVGMGGAMGALGGDISTISTNPAGIGIYRSNDIMFSFGFNNSASESTFSNSVLNNNKFVGSFDNAGFVYSNKIGNKTTLKFVNFAFNYHKKKNFNKAMLMGGDLNGLSQTSQFATMTNGLPLEDFNYLLDNPNFNAYNNRDWNDVGWLSIMGTRGNLLYYDRSDEITENGRTDYYDYYKGLPGVRNNYKSRESGGMNEYDFNIAFNIEDQFYFGVTIGAYDVDYSRFSSYTETVSTGSYTISNWYGTNGAGVDAKFGAIVRPVASLPLRIGVAIHTPTWFNLTDIHSARLESDITYEGQQYHAVQDTYDAAGNRVLDYQLITPWKYNFSLGYTIGKSVALGAEYEYTDYSTAKMKDPDGVVFGTTNDRVKQYLKGIHTVRVGVEGKLLPQFSVRAGYNYTTGSFKNGAFKLLPYDTTRTDTEFENIKGINNITVGLGYKGRVFYADLAYQLTMYKSDFYPFSNEYISYVPAKVNNDRPQLMMTLGVRF